MNPCVKTGVVFTNMLTGLTHTGDLFYTENSWQVKGIPAADGVPKTVAPRPVHVVFLNVGFFPRDRYVDTQTDLLIVAVSENFRKHVKEWYPELEKFLP